MPMDNKLIIQALYEEVWNKRKIDLVEVLISPSHSLQSPLVSGRAIGPEVYKDQIHMITTAYPDLRFTIEEMIAEDEKVACYWTLSGTQHGDFQGIPHTGKKISIDGITIHHVTNGKIMDSYVSLDLWGMMQQLGVAPAVGMPQGATAH